jgi:MoaA/NifB/PqqE/SkfB family radical SAM enzyme
VGRNEVKPNSLYIPDNDLKWMKLLPIAQRSINYLMNRPGPYFLSMDVTMRCNCRCKFCTIWTKPQLPREIEIENSSYKIMEKRLREAWQMGCRAVCFAGGEPTLYTHLSSLVSKAKTLGYYIEVITNGINLTQPEAWMRKIDSLAISFTTDPETYEKTRGLPVYEVVKDNIEKATAFGIKVVLFDMLNKDTLPHVEETAKFAHKLGVKLHIFSVTEQSRLDYEAIDWNDQRPENVYTEMEKVKKKWGRNIILWRGGEAMLAGICLNEKFRCRITETTVVVKSDGSVVLPCAAFPQYHSEPEENLSEFWNSVNAVEARKCCGKFKFCEGCVHQFCNYGSSLLGQPHQALSWLFESI